MAAVDEYRRLFLFKATLNAQRDEAENIIRWRAKDDLWLF